METLKKVQPRRFGDSLQIFKLYQQVRTQKSHSLEWLLNFISIIFYNKSITNDGKSPIAIFNKIAITATV